MIGAAPLLLAFTIKQENRLDEDEDTSRVFRNIPAAEQRFHTHYRNGSCLYSIAAKVIAYYLLHYFPRVQTTNCSFWLLA